MKSKFFDFILPSPFQYRTLYILDKTSCKIYISLERKYEVKVGFEVSISIYMQIRLFDLSSSDNLLHKHFFEFSFCIIFLQIPFLGPINVVSVTKRLLLSRNLNNTRSLIQVNNHKFFIMPLLPCLIKIILDSFEWVPWQL